MKLLALNCNQCGAPLEVPLRAKFVTCNFCSARLSVQRTDQVAYTEAIEEIQVRTREMAEDLEDLKAQGELERLDREWVDKRSSLMVRGTEGQLSVPGKTGAIAGGLIGIVFGIVWMSFTASLDSGGIFPLFGLVFICVAAFGMMRTFSKADAFEKARRKYQAERRKVIRSRAVDGQEGAGSTGEG